MNLILIKVKVKQMERNKNKLWVLWRKAYEEGSREGTDADSKCRGISTRYLNIYMRYMNEVGFRTRQKEEQRIQATIRRFQKCNEVLIKKSRYT